MIKRLGIGIFVLIMMFAFSSTISNGIHGLRTDQVEQTELDVITTSETTADVVLTEGSLFNGAVNQIVSITSTIDEEPHAASYDVDSDTLTVSNLTTSETRDLTITYYTEVTDQFMPVIGPFLPFLIFGGIIFAVIFSIWKGK